MFHDSLNMRFMRTPCMLQHFAFHVFLAFLYAFITDKTGLESMNEGGVELYVL